jgi:hypothetical protein
MPKVQASAEQMQRDDPAATQAVIRRWLGDAYQYGKV